MTDPHALTTVEQVRAIIGEENPVVRTKLFQGLEETAKAFIARSPLALLATADRDGRPDVSPKGDEPGFVAVEDDETLLLPDRKGNKLIFALQNILANPTVALIFLVPGTDETLRPRPRGAHRRPDGPPAPRGAQPARTARDPRQGRSLLLPLRQGVQALAPLASRDLAAEPPHLVREVARAPARGRSRSRRLDRRDDRGGLQDQPLSGRHLAPDRPTSVIWGACSTLPPRAP